MSDQQSTLSEEHIKEKMDALTKDLKKDESQKENTHQKEEDTSQKNEEKSQPQSEHTETSEEGISEAEKVRREAAKGITKKDKEVKARESLVQKAVERDPDYLIEVHQTDPELATKIAQSLWKMSYEELLTEAQKKTLSEPEKEKLDIKKEVVKELEQKYQADFSELQSIRIERGKKIIQDMEEKYPFFKTDSRPAFDRLNQTKLPNGGYAISLEDAIKLSYSGEMIRKAQEEAVSAQAYKEEASFLGGSKRYTGSKHIDLDPLEERMRLKLGVSKEKWLANKK